MKEMQLNTIGMTSRSHGTGGFMDPNSIVGYFGLTEGMRVADFGSGAGYFTILMAKRVGDGGVVTAVDILDSSLETLRAKAKMDGLGNIRTVRADIGMLGGSGLVENSQDIILLANILFQNADKRPIIAEARRTLKPGGSIIVIDWRKGTDGFGPPDDLRTDEEEMKQLVIANDGIQYTGEIDAGIFHYGMIFRKI
ncbi:MAG: class I SAM-dependent methyltransferase [Candidatus Yanofskybacteria bacterium]|nr:class I SAM-dependent methyltransferase [Candidatus Yanofskybacteria bacterium]